MPDSDYSAFAPRAGNKYNNSYQQQIFFMICFQVIIAHHHQKLTYHPGNLQVLIWMH